MPAFYAHDRFGTKVLEQMTPELSRIAARYEPSFRMGLQGPDIFFFYRPLTGKKVHRYGTHIHESVSAPFFRHAITVIRRSGRGSREYAYALGFLCHFVLDSECHPYIGEQIGRSGVAHMEIEAEFEKELLRLDGKDPVGFPVYRLVYTDRRTAKSIAPFYPSMDERTIRSALHSMKLVKWIFTAPDPVRQGIINGVLKALGLYHQWNGLMNQRRDNSLCLESNEVLPAKFNAAIPLAARLAEQFDDCIKNGTPLPARFRRTFE